MHEGEQKGSPVLVLIFRKIVWGCLEKNRWTVYSENEWTLYQQRLG